MAEGFDFKGLQEMNMAKYLKAHCKPVQIKKAKNAIVLTDFTLKGKKSKIVMLPFKKMKEATDLFKEIKKDKLHLLKKVALVSVAHADKEIILATMKGGLSGDMILAKGEAFFMSNFKLKLTVGAGAVDAAADAGDDTTAEDTTAADATAEDTTAADATPETSDSDAPMTKEERIAKRKAAKADRKEHRQDAKAERKEHRQDAKAERKTEANKKKARVTMGKMKNQLENMMKKLGIDV